MSSTQGGAAAQVLDELTAAEFQRNYLEGNRPVLVRGVSRSWARPAPWDFGSLAARHGARQVPLYDTLFSLRRISTLADYLTEHVGQPGGGDRPYLRWFTQQSTEPLPWADDVFADLAPWWSVPDWLPADGYEFPPIRTADDLRTMTAPGKGLFICGTGGRTRLHVDPWGTDAVLCHLIGLKRFVLFAPDQLAVLSGGGPLPDRTMADLDTTGPQAAFDQVLEPGDAIFIPGGWAHSAEALTDGLSLTWNFVHSSANRRFTEYLRDSGRADPTVAFFTGAVPAPPHRVRRR